MFGALTPRRGGREIKHSSNSMDMESIRARRARLEEIINVMRHPPLNRTASMSSAPLNKGPTSPAAAAPAAASWMTRRRSLEAPSSSRAPLTPTMPRRLPDGFLPMTPMTCRPFIQPLPNIGRYRDTENFPPPTALLRQVSGKRSSSSRPASPSSILATKGNSEEELNLDAPDEKRPATSKSRRSVTDVLIEEKEEDEILCSDDAIEDLVRGMGSSIKERRFDCTVKARKLLSRENNPPIAEFLKAGVLSPLMPLLQDEEDQKLQFEATWTLTNLASGNSEQTATIVNAGAIPALVRLLESENANVREQSAWAVGNISGEGGYYRNLLIQAGVVTPLIDALQINGSGITAKLTLVRVVAWVIANLFRHKGITISPEERRKCLGALKLLLNYKDDETLMDSLWGVSYVADMDEDSLDDVVSAGLVPLLVKHLSSDTKGVVVPALRGVGNIASGEDVQTDTVLDNQALPVLKKLLEDPRKNIKKDATWTISNITAGNRSQIQRVIDAGILPLIVQAIRCGNIAIQKEATWAASNLTAGGSESQLSALIDAHGVPALVEVLSVGETDIIAVALQALHSLMKVNGREEEVKKRVREEGGEEKLEVLVQYVDPSVCFKAEEILNALRGIQDASPKTDDSDEEDSELRSKRKC